MPTVLMVAVGTPPALEGASMADSQLRVETTASPARALAMAAEKVYDLLVLAGLTVDQQAAVAGEVHGHRRWRLVPVLYVVDPAAPGLAIPATFRPEMDGIVRGRAGDAEVQRRMGQLAREGTGEAEFLVAGPFELDPVRSRLRVDGQVIDLTVRESEIVAMLLGRPGRMISAAEIIERGWGTEADARYLQILRRHVSNIRRKLNGTPASRSVRTVRGSGYRLDLPKAS